MAGRCLGVDMHTGGLMGGTDTLLDLLPPPSQLGSWCGTSLRIHNMACKAKTKPVNDDTTTPIFRASNTTQRLLTTMDQNHHAASKFTLAEYAQHVPEAWRSTVMDNLMHMKFQVLFKEDVNKTVPQPGATTTQEDDKGDI
ncbi:hypothetical protein P691DRAFT_768209 [Macrolepiota fuliginosa MF-IS2]|uniref:Uncharacterized protein n=1 Tax=Macrolepiota fuliginosa MF-IS2 TaxID=1400762 RepID=A0A9P5WYM6_9AGAR|nr:hypothetical protein P691DRAFT_768209 [Macrolepiota fuliginosa MF-IS2]